MAKPFASSADTAPKAETLEVLADGVYALTAEGDPNVGAIEGEDFVVCIEARATPAAARDWLAKLREHTQKPVKYLVLTHYHAVRVLGASAFDAEHIIASEATRKLIEERGKQDWDSEFGRMPRLFKNPEEIPGLTWPTQTFEAEHRIELGGDRGHLDLKFCGRGHTAGDIVVWHEKSKTLFAGDLVEAQAALGLVTFLYGCRYFPETLPATHRVRRHPLGVAQVYARLLQRIPFLLMTLSAGFVGGSLFAYLGGSAFVFMGSYRLEPVTYSMIIAAIALGIILAGWLNSRLLDKHGESTILSAGMLVHALACLLLAAAASVEQLPLLIYTGGLFVALSTTALTFGNGTALAMAEAGPEAGMGSAILGVAQSLVSATAGVVMALTGTDHRGMMYAMSFFAVLALAFKLAASMHSKAASAERG